MTDRLQQAIQKARDERGKTDTAHSASPRTPGRPGRASSTTSAENLRAAWQELAPLHMQPKTILRNRLVAYSSGEHAIPYDMLRTKVLQQAKKNNWKRIALVSPSSACGKSTTAANLGFSFSRMSEVRTIVLDFDLRRMGLAKILGQKVKYGMRDVLQRQVTFAEHGLCHDGNVAFGLNSKVGANPSEILQSQQAAEVLDEIEATYKPDIMLFDSPPLMSSDDSHGFLRHVDCALLLAVAEKTPMDQIDVCERQLSELTNVMGIILNRCRYTTGAHGYEHEYY
ncbi:CpsD/CapB family tyrosine-protein kinase [Arenibacterium sp. CAU 1754]